MADTADATIRAIRTVVGSLGIGMAHRTMSLPCILGAETDTPQNVLATADRLHMCGINTGAVATAGRAKNVRTLTATDTSAVAVAV